MCNQYNRVTCPRYRSTGETVKRCVKECHGSQFFGGTKGYAEPVYVKWVEQGVDPCVDWWSRGGRKCRTAVNSDFEEEESVCEIFSALRMFLRFRQNTVQIPAVVSRMQSVWNKFYARQSPRRTTSRSKVFPKIVSPCLRSEREDSERRLNYSRNGCATRAREERQASGHESWRT